MQNKDQTFSKSCEFKALIDKDMWKHVKALRGDNGGDYISNEFNNLCIKEGIERELIVPHNHNTMGLLGERTGQFLVQQERCCMIRAYHCIYGQRHSTQRYFYRTVSLLGYLA